MSRIYKQTSFTSDDLFATVSFGGGGGGYHPNPGIESTYTQTSQSTNTEPSSTIYTGTSSSSDSNSSANSGGDGGSTGFVNHSNSSDQNETSLAETICAASTATQNVAIVATLHPASPPPLKLGAAAVGVVSTITQAVSCGYAVGNSGGKYEPASGIGPIK